MVQGAWCVVQSYPDDWKKGLRVDGIGLKA
jgi:hypothetical protein